MAKKKTIVETVAEILTESTEIKEETSLEQFFLTVNTEKLNVRSKASTTSEVLGVVNKGDRLEVATRIIDNGFFCVNYKGNKGYVMQEFVLL